MTIQTTFKTAICSALALAFCTSVPAYANSSDDPNAAVLQALEDAIPGTLLHNPLEINWKPTGSELRTKVVDAAELTTGQAIQGRVKKRSDKPWESNLMAEITGAVAAGDKIQILYWVRTVKPMKGQETAKVSVFLGRNVEPYDYIVAEEIFPGTEWEMKQITATADKDFDAGKVKLEYQLGYGSQTLEFGPVYVSKLD
jgi:hypothetical protein